MDDRPPGGEGRVCEDHRSGRRGGGMGGLVRFLQRFSIWEGDGRRGGREGNMLTGRGGMDGWMDRGNEVGWLSPPILIRPRSCVSLLALPNGHGRRRRAQPDVHTGCMCILCRSDCPAKACLLYEAGKGTRGGANVQVG